MLSTRKTHVVPLGCSCVCQTQLQYVADNRWRRAQLKSTPFDWNITTPGSTIQFLRLLAEGELPQVLSTRGNYDLEAGHLRNTVFDGLYFWHEHGDEVLSSAEHFDDFVSKTLHKLANFVSAADSGSVKCLWSNIQPNLMDTTAELSVPWSDFRLTAALYDEMSGEMAAVFGASAALYVAARPGDIDDDLRDRPGVFVLDVPRGPDHKGDRGVFDPIFRQMGVIR